MNREQMVEAAADAILDACFGIDPPEAPVDLARAAVDAILPQVTTVEELEALSPRALVLKDFGNRAQAEEAGVIARAIRALGPDFLPTEPMTVVWWP